MAKLYGSVQGNWGEATRLGNERLTARAQGWNSGVTVEAFATTPDTREFILTENGGSNGTGGTFSLGIIEQDVASGRVRFVVSSKLAEALNALLDAEVPRERGSARRFRMGDRVELKAGWQG